MGVGAVKLPANVVSVYQINWFPVSPFAVNGVAWSFWQYITGETTSGKLGVGLITIVLEETGELQLFWDTNTEYKPAAFIVAFGIFMDELVPVWLKPLGPVQVYIAPLIGLVVLIIRLVVVQNGPASFKTGATGGIGSTNRKAPILLE